MPWTPAETDIWQWSSLKRQIILRDVEWDLNEVHLLLRGIFARFVFRQLKKKTSVQESVNKDTHLYGIHPFFRCLIGIQ